MKYTDTNLKISKKIKDTIHDKKDDGMLHDKKDTKFNNEKKQKAQKKSRS